MPAKTKALNAPEQMASDASGKAQRPHCRRLDTVVGILLVAMSLSVINGCRSRPAGVPSLPLFETPNHFLIASAHRDDFTGVNAALLNGADPNAIDEHGSPALCDAAGYGDVRMARLLVTHGATVNFVSHTGDNALMDACYGPDERTPPCSKQETVRFLLSHGADVNIKDGEKRTALFYLCADSWEGLLPTPESKRALAAMRFFAPHAKEIPLDSPVVLRLLLAHGAIIHYKDMHGVSPIQEAKKRGNLHTVEFLIEHDKPQFRAEDRQEADAYDIDGQPIDPAETPYRTGDLNPPGHNTFVYVALDAADAHGRWLTGYCRTKHGFRRIPDLGYAPFGDDDALIEAPDERFVFQEHRANGDDPNSSIGYIEYALLPGGQLHKVQTKWFAGTQMGLGLSFDAIGKFAYMMSAHPPRTVLSYRVTPEGRFLPLSGTPPPCGENFGGLARIGTHVYQMDRNDLLWQYRILPDGRLRPETPAHLTCGSNLEPMGITALADERTVYVGCIERINSPGVHGRIFQFSASSGSLRPLNPPVVSYGNRFEGAQAVSNSRQVYVTSDGTIRVFNVATNGTLKPTSVYLKDIEGVSSDDRTSTAYGISLSDGNLRMFKTERNGALTPVPGFAARQSARVSDIMIVHR